MNSPRRVRLRATLLEVVVTLVTLGLGVLLGPTVDPDPGQPFAALLGQWCTIVLLCCAVWAWLVTTLVLLEALRAPGAATLRRRRRGVPSAYRRLVLGACGLALSATATAPALATPGPVQLDPHPATALTTAPVLEAREPAQSRPHEQARPHGQAAADIVVRAGDSLWRLAADRLPDDADDATIGHAWRRLYAANGEVIGADPDHIEPGQRLAQPRGW